MVNVYYIYYVFIAPGQEALYSHSISLQQGVWKNIGELFISRPISSRARLFKARLSKSRVNPG